MNALYEAFLAESARIRRRVKRLYKDGKGKRQAEIARIVGISRQRVHQILRAKANAT